MSPYEGDRSSFARPTGNGCPEALEMVGTRRQTWKLNRGLDLRRLALNAFWLCGTCPDTWENTLMRRHW